MLVPVERRSGTDRRHAPDRRGRDERRSGVERRRQETVGDHIRSAVQLIAHVAELDALDDEHRRELDTAIFRLRFALDRLEQS
jgi:hypothetical protein